MNDNARKRTDESPRPHPAKNDPRKMSRAMGPLVAVALLFIIAGAGWMGASIAATGADAGDLYEPSMTVPALAVDLSVQPLYLSDGTVYVLTLGTMSTLDDQVVTFNSGQVYDFIVTQDGRELWRWSRGRAFHQAFVERTFKAGELETFTEIWDGRDSDGETVSGTVEVRGVMTGVKPLETKPVTVQLN